MKKKQKLEIGSKQMIKRKKTKCNKTLNPVEIYKKKISKYLVLTENHDYIDFVWGVIYANRLDVKPIWAYLIGPSSAGKTTILDPMNGHESIVSIDALSKASLLPGVKPGRPTKNTAKMAVKNSLLSRANGKILVIKDLSPLLTEDYKELKSILGILRSAYDGKFTKSFGNIGMVEIDCRFGLIAAVTDAIDNHSVMDSELGQRFIGYRMPAISAKEEMAICDAVLNNKESVLNEALQEAAYEMLDREPKEPSITKKQADTLKYTAKIVAMARTGIVRDRYTRDPKVSRPERTARLYSQLISLAKGVAMSRGHRRVMGEDVVFVRHVAAHTLSLDMLRLLNMFVDRRILTVKNLQDRFFWCEATCQRALENLQIVGITEKEVIAGAKGRDVAAWTLKMADQWEKMLRKLDYDVAYSGAESRKGKRIKF
jgi:predicted transcriptional regulator